MRAVLDIVLLVLQLYIYVVFASVIMSWLLAFNIVNYSNAFVRAVWDTLNALTEPLLRPIRRFMPNLGTIDLSPVVLLLGIIFLQRIIVYYLYPTLGRY